MPKVTIRKMWHAEVEVEIERLALSVQYEERGKGSAKTRYLTPTDWLDADNKTILLDPGKRLKGWLKEQVATMKSSWKDRIQYGVMCKSLPTAGYVPIANLEEITPSRNWDTFTHREDYNLHGLPKPNVEMILTGEGRSVFAFHYVLKNPVNVKIAIFSFAYGVRPEIVEEWLQTLGKIKGLGDMHNSSAGYGCFEVKSFKVVEEKDLNF